VVGPVEGDELLHENADELLLAVDPFVSTGS